MALAAGEHRLNVGHDGLQVLALVQEHAVPVGHLVFPVLLPLAQGIFLKETVSADDEHGGSCLEANTPLDADDGITHMAVTSDTVGSTNLLHLLDGLYLVIIVYTVHRTEFSLLKSKTEHFGSLLRHVLQVGRFGQSLCRVQYLASADGSSPDAHVVRVLQFREVRIITVGIEVVHLLLTREVAVTGQGNDFHTGCHHQEGHVETYLVIAGTRRTMCYGIGSNLLGIACYGQRLEDALRAHRNGVTVVSQHIAKHHVFQGLLVVLLCHVQRHIFHCAQLVGILLILLQLFLAEATGICTGCINLVSHLFGEIHHVVTCIQATTEGHHYFLLCHYSMFLFSS